MSMTMSDTAIQWVAIGAGAVAIVGTGIATTALIRECGDRKEIGALKGRTTAIEQAQACSTFTYEQRGVLAAMADDKLAKVIAMTNASLGAAPQPAPTAPAQQPAPAPAPQQPQYASAADVAALQQQIASLQAMLQQQQATTPQP